MGEASVALHRVATARPDQQLGLVGRVLVAAVVLPGIAVGALSGLGLIWFIPYAGTGAILAIRRPRVAIGWLLIVLGWALVVAALATMDPTDPLFVAQPALAEVSSFWGQAGWPAIFGLFAILAVLLPDGHLSGGRWRPITIGSSALAVILVAIAAIVPSAADFMVPPMLVVLTISAASLLARRARARGVERQQLRWIIAAIVLVFVAFAVGLALASINPAADETGLAWAPTAIAFPTVPIAIGIAVLRYRLYQIDTVINRAIVYALLTAVLAGATSAVIGVTQKLFAGVIGGSDVTIVVTTLVVVAAFDPVRKRLQAVVDRRYQPAPDPEKAFADYVSELRSSPSSLSVPRTLERFATIAKLVFAADGGRVEIAQRGDVATYDAGDLSGDASVVVGATREGAAATVTLFGAGPRAEADAVLHAALAAVLMELSRDAPSGPWPIAEPS